MPLSQGYRWRAAILLTVARTEGRDPDEAKTLASTSRGHVPRAITRLHRCRALPRAVVAWPACDNLPFQNLFVGETHSVSNLKGVYAEIEYFNEKLCVQGASPDPSWSLSWVSLDGQNSDSVPGLAIYQGGYAKCPPPSVGTCPWNSGAPYYWYFYGREQGVCGAAFNTGIVKAPKGNATSGIHEFQISEVSSTYYFWIDHVVQNSRPQSDIDTCWGRIPLVEWENEMADPGDQNGGTVSNHQSYGNTQFQDNAGWHAHSLSLGQPCQNNAQPSVWRCFVASNVGDYFYSWDTRAP